MSFSKKKMSKNTLIDTEADRAYIAGFLDGYGSIIFQILKNNSFKYGFQLRISIGFYQKIEKHWFMLYLDKILNKSGNLRKRSNQITTQTILKEDKIRIFLLEVLPQLVIKKPQAKLALEILKKKSMIETKSDFLKVCKLIDDAAKLNQSKNRKITFQVVAESLKSPVETLSFG